MMGTARPDDAEHDRAHGEDQRRLDRECERRAHLRGGTPAAKDAAMRGDYGTMRYTSPRSVVM